MNLYLLTQEENNAYYACKSAVVSAATKKDARRIYPRGYKALKSGWFDGLVPIQFDYEWTTPAKVKATLLGLAMPDLASSVILASFDAGYPKK